MRFIKRVLNSGWFYVALAMLLVSLLAGYFVRVQLVTNHMQLYIVHNQSQPMTDRIIIRSLVMGFGDASTLSCDGVRFRRGFPDQAFYSGDGWYVDVPTLAPGEQHHCVFSNSLRTLRLALPSRVIPFVPIISPSATASLPLSSPVLITFTDCGALKRWIGVATDAHGHSALSIGGGCGLTGGRLTFQPPQQFGFVAGQGTVEIHNTDMATLYPSDWEFVAVTYDNVSIG